MNVRWKTSFDRWRKAFFAEDGRIDAVVDESVLYAIVGTFGQHPADSKPIQPVEKIVLEPPLLDSCLAKPPIKPVCLEPLLHVAVISVKASGLPPISQPCLGLCWNIAIDRREELRQIEHQADDRCALVKSKLRLPIDDQLAGLSYLSCEDDELAVNAPEIKHSAQAMPLESPITLDPPSKARPLQLPVNFDRARMVVGGKQHMRRFTAISDLFFMDSGGARVAPFIEAEHLPLLTSDTILRVANQGKLPVQSHVSSDQSTKQASTALKASRTEPEMEPFERTPGMPVELPRIPHSAPPLLTLNVKRLVISTALLQHYLLIDTFPRDTELIERTGDDKLIYLNESTAVQIAQPGEAVSCLAGILIVEWYTSDGEAVKLRRDNLPYACKARIYHSSSPTHTQRLIASIATDTRLDFDASTSMVPLCLCAVLCLFSGSASQVQSAAIHCLPKHKSEQGIQGSFC